MNSNTAPDYLFICALLLYSLHVAVSINKYYVYSYFHL